MIEIWIWYELEFPFELSSNPQKCTKINFVMWTHLLEHRFDSHVKWAIEDWAKYFLCYIVASIYEM